MKDQSLGFKETRETGKVKAMRDCELGPKPGKMCFFCYREHE